MFFSENHISTELTVVVNWDVWLFSKFRSFIIQITLDRLIGRDEFFDRWIALLLWNIYNSIIQEVVGVKCILNYKNFQRVLIFRKIVRDKFCPYTFFPVIYFSRHISLHFLYFSNIFKQNYFWYILSISVTL